MYNVGQRIYYTGDMANRSGWGIITNARPCKWYSLNYMLEMQDGRIFTIHPHMISDTFNGSSTFRFITKEAYDEYRNLALAQYA
jgi:hypothetical protein